jgi:hypothetical protein
VPIPSVEKVEKVFECLVFYVNVNVLFFHCMFIEQAAVEVGIRPYFCSNWTALFPSQ